MTGASVLDASAVLALLLGEPGTERVAARLASARMSVANLAEVAAKYVDFGQDPAVLTARLAGLGVIFEPVTAADVPVQAQLRRQDRAHATTGPKLSLADRLCLALAIRLDLPAVTADRAWAGLELPIELALIR